MKWGRCGARGRGMNAPPKLPGGAGVPPGGTTTPREELADGGPLGLPEAQKTMVTRRQRLRAGGGTKRNAGSAARRRNDAAMERREAPAFSKRERGT